jgi:hypothetical protein
MGKQNVWFRSALIFPANMGFSGVIIALRFPGFHRESTGF